MFIDITKQVMANQPAMTGGAEVVLRSARRKISSDGGEPLVDRPRVTKKEKVRSVRQKTKHMSRYGTTNGRKSD